MLFVEKTFPNNSCWYTLYLLALVPISNMGIISHVQTERGSYDMFNLLAWNTTFNKCMMYASIIYLWVYVITSVPHPSPGEFRV